MCFRVRLSARLAVWALADFVCASVRLFVCLSVCLFVCLFVFLFAGLSVRSLVRLTDRTKKMPETLAMSAQSNSKSFENCGWSVAAGFQKCPKSLENPHGRDPGRCPKGLEGLET